jgi:hypothetical protein
VKLTKTLIENRLKNALRRLYFHDSALIVNDVHERSITHRLAVHLGTVFYEWDVDVEYNRNAGDVKRISEVTMDLLSQISDMQEVVFGGKTVYPDIIIHKRNTSENLLVIEVKKVHSTEYSDQYHLEKLKAYLLEDTLRYKYAAFIKLGEVYDECKIEIVKKKKTKNGDWSLESYTVNIYREFSPVP